MLYGAVNVSQPKAPEFFKEATAGLKQMQLLKEAEKKQEEATEKAARAAMVDPSSANPATTWDSIGGAAEKAAEQLRGMKDELMKTEEGRAQYQTYINELDQLIQYGEEDYKTTFSVANNNMTNLRTGVEYEGRMQDNRTLSQYEEQMMLDDNRNRYNVRFENGHLVLDDGSGAMRVGDPRLFNTTRYDAKLERMEPVDPDTFYRRNAYRPYIEKEDQARQAVQDELSSSKRNRLDAIEWWLRNDPAGQDEAEKGLTADKILAEGQGGSLSTALKSYTDAAVEGWQNMTTEKKQKEKDKKDGKKDSEKTPAYLNDGLFSVEPVLDDEGEGVLSQEELDARDALGYTETYTLKTPMIMEGTKMTKITYDTTSEPMQWVVSFANGETIEIPEEYNPDIGKFVPGNIPDNNAGGAGESIRPDLFFDAKNSKSGAFAETLMEIRERALRGG